MTRYWSQSSSLSLRPLGTRTAITGVLLTPYPPGIPLLIPGERFNRDIVDYLKFTQEFNHQFPGFETDVHGLAYDTDDNGQRHYYVDCIREDAIDA